MTLDQVNKRNKAPHINHKSNPNELNWGQSKPLSNVSDVDRKGTAAGTKVEPVKKFSARALYEADDDDDDEIDYGDALPSSYSSKATNNSNYHRVICVL